MSPLERHIRALIDGNGPITVAEYMSLALGHPRHGYYMTGDPLGAAGDFVTAPEIGQVFGELIGLWAAVAWQQTGSPARTLLVELGPGRGTLMADALRAARTAPGFLDAVEVHLVESSPVLRARQAQTLADAAPVWHESIDSVPEAPAIFIANEFFDALPVHQYVRTRDGWSERRVGITDGRLAFVVGEPVPEDRRPRVRAAAGEIFEISRDAAAVAAETGRRLSADGGVALVIDYGHAVPATGETLQAVRRHRYADPLSAPGTADLTAHVDFAALADAFRRGGGRSFGPVSQGAFLCALGIRERTERLTRNADPATAARLHAATNRLINADQMGTLFKAMAATVPAAPPPAGFES